MVGHKTYYRTSDVREFVRSHMDFQTYQDFEKKHPKPKGEDKNLEIDEWFCFLRFKQNRANDGGLFLIYASC